MSKSSRKRRKSRAKKRSGLPKGAYRVPGGGYMLDDADVITFSEDGKRYRRSRAVFKDNIDTKKLARALIAVEIHNDAHRRGVQFGDDPNVCAQGCGYSKQLQEERHRKAIETIRKAINPNSLSPEEARALLVERWERMGS